MAAWADLVAFIRSEYEVVRVAPDEIRIRIRFGGDIDEGERAQIMVIARTNLAHRGDWVQIVTPFARAGQVDPRAVLEELGDTTVVGGVAIIDGHLVLRHALPLINLDINEFVDPLELLAGTADQLEIRFVGRDDY